MTRSRDTVTSLRALCQHLNWFANLVADHASQIMRKTHSPWSPELHGRAAEELLEAMRNTYFGLLTKIGGRVAFATTSAGESGIRDTVLFRWYAPERTVDLLSELDPDSAQGFLVARSLCVLAEHQLHSLRESDLAVVFQEDCFLENLGKLSHLYRRFGVDVWASYFDQVVLAQRDGYLEEFVALSPFGNRAWVFPKPYEWRDVSPDAFLELLLQMAEAVEFALSSAFYRSEPPSQIRKMILDVTSTVVRAASPECFINLMRSFNEQLGAGRKKAELFMEAFERIRRVHLVAVGNLGVRASE